MKRDTAKVIVRDLDTGDEWAAYTGNARNPRLVKIIKAQAADTSVVLVGTTINGAGPYTVEEIERLQREAEPS